MTTPEDAAFEETQQLHTAEPTRVMTLGGSGGQSVDFGDPEAAAQRQAEAAAAAEAEMARIRAEERAARDRALGTIRSGSVPEPVAVERQSVRTTDKFFGSLGFFLLRLVTAAIVGTHGAQKLLDIPATQAFFENVGLPYAEYLAWGVGTAEVLAAVALIFGFLTRVAGAGIAAIAISALSLVKWGLVNPFVAGQAGFIGELELLLAGVGIVLMLVGGGGWGIDAGIRRGRQQSE